MGLRIKITARLFLQARANAISLALASLMLAVQNEPRQPNVAQKVKLKVYKEQGKRKRVLGI